MAESELRGEMKRALLCFQFFNSGFKETMPTYLIYFKEQGYLSYAKFYEPTGISYPSTSFKYFLPCTIQRPAILIRLYVYTPFYYF